MNSTFHIYVKKLKMNFLLFLDKEGEILKIAERYWHEFLAFTEACHILCN